MARILIVDHDRSFREALAESLVDLGYEVIEASDAETALNLIKDAEVIFVDLRMPDKSGIDFLREAKPKVPVVVLTAFADSSNTIEAIKLGTFDHLTKPIGRSDLQRVLSAGLKKPKSITKERPAILEGELIGFCDGMRDVQKKIGVG